MSKAIKAPSAAEQQDPKILQLVQNPEETMAQTVGRIASDPAVNAGSIMQSFGNHLGNDVSLMSMIDAIQGTTQRIKGGDLSDLEAMLLSQATALQTIFTNLARRAQAQQYQRNLEAFLALAFKAQAQSRATISALVDLKYPRQATFVKQANIANGPQQVNNGAGSAGEIAHARGRTPQQNELLEDASNGRTYLDTGATPMATRGDSAVEAVEQVHRAKKPRR